MIELSGFESVEDIAKLRETAAAAMLSRKALIEYLRRCKRGELSAPEVSAIASDLEFVDEVEYEHGAEKMIATALFEIASPEMHGVLTPEYCSDLIDFLEG